MADRGRPSLYTAEIATEICRRLADGESLNAICKDEGFPHESTVRAWALDDVEGFSTKYTRAREIQAHLYADSIMDIADNPEIGEKVTIEADGSEKIQRGDMIEHRRLRVDSRKWIVAKMLPKIYGDKLQTEHSGGITVQVVKFGDDPNT